MVIYSLSLLHGSFGLCRTCKFSESDTTSDCIVTQKNRQDQKIRRTKKSKGMYSDITKISIWFSGRDDVQDYVYGISVNDDWSLAVLLR